MSSLNGITFTSWNTNVSKHSYTDFGVILTEQNIGLPSPKTYSVSIEGMDGSLDLSMLSKVNFSVLFSYFISPKHSDKSRLPSMPSMLTL